MNQNIVSLSMFNISKLKPIKIIDTGNKIKGVFSY